MGTHILNGNGYHESCAHTPEDLNNYLLMFHDPCQAVEQSIDEAACKIDGQEKNLTQVVAVFVEENPSLFGRKSSEEKVAILFDAYRDAYLEVLKEGQDYKKALIQVKKSPMQRLAPPTQLEQAIEWLVIRRLKVLHSTTVANAIQQHLGENSYLSLADLPDTYIHRECDNKALVKFFKKLIKV